MRKKIIMQTCKTSKPEVSANRTEPIYFVEVFSD